MASAAPTANFTAHSLAKNITLYTSELASPASGRETQKSDDHKPLMLMLPWLGSTHQAMAKYRDIYFRNGFDVLVVESEVKEFLWPRWGLDRGESLLELLQSDRFVSRPLHVHAFSIGGFTFAQLLVHLSQDRQKYQGLTERIKGQIYDSLVVGSLDNMSTGLSKTLFPHCESLVKHVSAWYFSVFKSQTVDYYETSIDAFLNTPINAPALFFFCENDVMSDSKALEELITHWRRHGIRVTMKKWEDSTHAGHLKRHPKEYLTTLTKFLHSLNFRPLKAKL